MVQGLRLGFRDLGLGLRVQGLGFIIYYLRVLRASVFTISGFMV